MLSELQIGGGRPVVDHVEMTSLFRFEVLKNKMKDRSRHKLRRESIETIVVVCIAIACGIFAYMTITEKSKVTYGREIPAEQRVIIKQLVLQLSRSVDPQESSIRMVNHRYSWSIAGSTQWKRMFPTADSGSRIQSSDVLKSWIDGVWQRVAMTQYDGKTCGPVILTNEQDFLVVVVPMSRDQFAEMLLLNQESPASGDSFRLSCANRVGTRSTIHLYDSRHGFRSKPSDLVIQFLLSHK